jgi:hypothetical protein
VVDTDELVDTLGERVGEGLLLELDQPIDQGRACCKDAGLGGLLAYGGDLPTGSLIVDLGV